MNKLLALRRVDDNGPATKDLGSGVFQVEPGDMTRYTVQLGASHALGFVKDPGFFADELEKSRVFSLFDTTALNNSHAASAGSGLSKYTTEVLEYFCALALGLDCEEPADLAERRKHG